MGVEWLRSDERQMLQHFRRFGAGDQCQVVNYQYLLRISQCHGAESCTQRRSDWAKSNSSPSMVYDTAEPRKRLDGLHGPYLVPSASSPEIHECSGPSPSRFPSPSR